MWGLTLWPMVPRRCIQGAAKKTPLQKLQFSKRRNFFVRNFQRLLGRKFAIDGKKFRAILRKFAKMVRLLIFNALFSSERALLSV